MGWRELLNYWREHHVEGHPPSRSDIDPPLEVPRLLPNLMLYRVEPEGFRLRLVGSELAKRAGRDLTGQMLDPTRKTMNIVPFLAALQKVVATRSPVLFSVGRSAESAFGAMVLLLPLIDRDRDNVNIILGGVFYESVPERHAFVPWRPGAFTELNLEEELRRIPDARYGR